MATIGLMLGCFGADPAAQEAAPPLTLDEARRLVTQNNLSLQIAREKLKQAELLIDKSWVMVKPQWNATGTYTHHNVAIDFDIPDFTSINFDEQACGANWIPELGLCFTRYDRQVFQRQDSFAFYSTLSQPLFLARAISTIKNAYNTYDLARINEENVEDTLRYSLEVAYFAALATERYLDIARRSLELRRHHWTIARTKFEEGETVRMSALRAEIDVNRAEQDVKTAEMSLQLAKETVRLLTGREKDFCLVPPPPPDRPAETLERYIERALGTRRDLAAARINLAIAEELKRDAWYRFLPSVTLTGLLQVNDVKGFTDSYVQWYVGVVLSVPLYDGGLRYAYLDEAKSRIREATLAIEDTRRGIASEMRQSWLRMEMAEANLVKARRTVELAREQVELAKVAFEAGSSTDLEVSDANYLLFTSEMSVASEELNLQLAILRLERAVEMFVPGLGGGSAGATESPGAGASGIPATAPAASSLDVLFGK